MKRTAFKKKPTHKGFQRKYKPRTLASLSTLKPDIFAATYEATPVGGEGE